MGTGLQEGPRGLATSPPFASTHQLRLSRRTPALSVRGHAVGEHEPPELERLTERLQLGERQGQDLPANWDAQDRDAEKVTSPIPESIPEAAGNVTGSVVISLHVRLRRSIFDWRGFILRGVESALGSMPPVGSPVTPALTPLA
jgi:hypothetical protein